MSCAQVPPTGVRPGWRYALTVIRASAVVRRTMQVMLARLFMLVLLVATLSYMVALNGFDVVALSFAVLWVGCFGQLLRLQSRRREQDVSSA